MNSYNGLIKLSGFLRSLGLFEEAYLAHSLRLHADKGIYSHRKMAALLDPPPRMLEAAKYFFVSRWGMGVLEEIKRKERSQKARLRKAQKMLQIQEASIEAALESFRKEEPFDLIVYHAPEDPSGSSYSRVLKRVIRYTPEEVRDEWGDFAYVGWKVDRPFSMGDQDFRGEIVEWEIEMGINHLVGPDFLKGLIWHINNNIKSLNDVKDKVTQAIKESKPEVDLLEEGDSPNKAFCKMDFTGWPLWERRVPDEEERRKLESAEDSRKMLSFEFDPQETGDRFEDDESFLAYWLPSKWQIVFAGLSGYWSVKNLIGSHGEVDSSFFEESLSELEETVAHEMRHYAQSLLKRLLGLSNIAGHPGLTDPSVANTGGAPLMWEEEISLKLHEKMNGKNEPLSEAENVKFEAKLEEEVESFIMGFNRIRNEIAKGKLTGPHKSEKKWGPYYYKAFTADYPDKLVRFFGFEWHPSEWFRALKESDPWLYLAARSKFANKLDDLGYMKRIGREKKIDWRLTLIPHEIRDVEFETRLGDEVERFKRGWKSLKEEISYKRNRELKTVINPYERKSIEKIFKILSREAGLDYFDNFIARREIRPPTGIWIAEWQPSYWFSDLKENDPKRYKAAIAKFVAELDRLGYMSEMERQTPSPMIAPKHPAWGLSVVRYFDRKMPFFNREHEEEVKLLREYEDFINSLNIFELRRHRALVRKEGDKEYWVTPRWQDHMKQPLSSEEMEARRTEAANLEHPLMLSSYSKKKK